MGDVELIQLYQTKNTIKSIALKDSTTVDRIRTRLKKLGVYVQTKKYKIDLPEQEICDMYKRDVAVCDIAEMYGVSTQPIVSILTKYQVRKPNQFKQLPYAVYMQVINREFFISIVSECISKSNVADKLHITYDMVASLYKYHKIKNTSSSDVRSLLNQQSAPVEFNRDNFEQLHYNQFVSLRDISKQMGVSTGLLKKTMTNSWNLQPLPTGEVRLSSQFRSIRNDVEYLIDEVSKYPVTHLCKKYNVSADVMFRTLREHNIDLPFRTRSLGEQQIYEYVQQLLPNTQIDLCSRKIIHPYELDIYIPEKRLAIEFCGLYWHSDKQGKDSKYHVNKLQMCNDLGIRLLTIFEDEYSAKPTLVHMRISHCLGLYSQTKINARDCVVEEITPVVKNNFLDTYHIQGHDICRYSLGLFFQDKLVSVMTFARPSRARNSIQRMNDETLWELNRFASSNEYHVRGAAGKLLKHFQRHHVWTEIYSYADRRWSAGELYYALGFTLTSISAPNYWYLNNRFKHREYRFQYTKQSLVTQGFSKDKTERQIMEERGYSRIWDCGVLKMTIINTTQ